MEKRYGQLSPEERYRISFLQREGKSIRQIAAVMDRSPSTISREIKRNKAKTFGYEARYAQQQTAARRWRGSKMERQPALRTTVLDLLAMGWSPQQVASRLAQEQGCNVISYESIYRFIDKQIRRTKDYSWRHYLPRGKSKRGRYGRKGRSPILFIKQRVPIDKRPSYIEKRASIGHWEADLMLFSTYGQGLLVVHERYSRILFLLKIENKESKTIIGQLINLFSCLPKQLIKTITFDNGTEFAAHHQLNELDMKTYFCDVRSPWQKGGVENAIGRMRRTLPRRTNIDQLQDQDLKELVGLYNHTPRKCLGYKTPAEVFIKQLLHLKCESTSPLSRG
jgi:transposase, IS30 family